jgi:hypothetical protein
VPRRLRRAGPGRQRGASGDEHERASHHDRVQPRHPSQRGVTGGGGAGAPRIVVSVVGDHDDSLRPQADARLSTA